MNSRGSTVTARCSGRRRRGSGRSRSPIPRARRLRSSRVHRGDEVRRQLEAVADEGAEPVRAKLSRYTPGRRSTMLYRPFSSVTIVRTFSMSAGLVASTVTPGSTPPLASRTVPENPLCAEASAAASTQQTTGCRRAFAKTLQFIRNTSRAERLPGDTGPRPHQRCSPGRRFQADRRTQHGSPPPCPSATPHGHHDCDARPNGHTATRYASARMVSPADSQVNYGPGRMTLHPARTGQPRMLDWQAVYRQRLSGRRHARPDADLLATRRRPMYESGSIGNRGGWDEVVDCCGALLTLSGGGCRLRSACQGSLHQQPAGGGDDGQGRPDHRR